MDLSETMSDSHRVNEFVIPEKRSVASHVKKFSIESLENQTLHQMVNKSDIDSSGRPSLLSTMRQKFQQFLAIPEIIYEAASSP